MRSSSRSSATTAQKNKVNHILKKINIKPGQTSLDIGCAWGELIISAAQKYKVKAMGITLSSEQLAAIKKRIEKEGLKEFVSNIIMILNVFFTFFKVIRNLLNKIRIFTAFT